MKSKFWMCLFRAFYYIALAALIFVLILPYTSLYHRSAISDSFYVRANTSPIYLVKGERYQIHLFGIKKIATYSSQNFRVASVNKNGTVRANKCGRTVIVIKRGKKVLKRKVYVFDISKKMFTILRGKKTRLYVKGNYPGRVKWSSSNERIVTVNWKGKIKAKKRGTAYVTATVKGKKMKCKVIVI